jgi:hypothetical protein
LSSEMPSSQGFGGFLFCLLAFTGRCSFIGIVKLDKLITLITCDEIELDRNKEASNNRG